MRTDAYQAAIMHHQKFIEGKVLQEALAESGSGAVEFWGLDCRCLNLGDDGFCNGAGCDGCGVRDWNTLGVLRSCRRETSKLRDTSGHFRRSVFVLKDISLP